MNDVSCSLAGKERHCQRQPSSLAGKGWRWPEFGNFFCQEFPFAKFRDANFATEGDAHPPQCTVVFAFLVVPRYVFPCVAF